MRDIDMSTAAYHRVRLNIEFGLSKKFYGTYSDWKSRKDSFHLTKKYFDVLEMFLVRDPVSLKLKITK